jgi:predicted Zn-dependent protease
VDNLSAIYDRATFLFEAKRYAEAADLFAQLAEAEPNYHEVQLYLARAYYYSAQLGRAEQTLRAIVERWPSDAYAYFVLARTLQRAGRAEEGRRYLLIAQAMGMED